MGKSAVGLPSRQSVYIIDTATVVFHLPSGNKASFSFYTLPMEAYDNLLLSVKDRVIEFMSHSGKYSENELVNMCNQEGYG